MPTLYRNFDIELFAHLTDGDVERFSVRVLNSPAGQQSIGEAELVKFGPDLRAQVLKLERRELDVDGMAQVGSALAELLFPPSVRGLFFDSRSLLGEMAALRIRLRADSFELSELPWEYVYIQRGHSGTAEFLALNRLISIVRFEALGIPSGDLNGMKDGPFQVAALLANITNDADGAYPPLDLPAERRSLEPISKVSRARLKVYERGTVQELEDAVTGGLDVFHFAGHGTFTRGSQAGGFIILCDDDGSPLEFPADHLTQNLKGTGLRLAVLSACETARRDFASRWTGVAPALTRAGVPAVLGMQYRIRDRNACFFGDRFYQALARGLPVDAAVAAGRIAIYNRAEADRDWGVPVLYMRAEEGVLFPQTEITADASTWETLHARATELAARLSPGSYGSGGAVGSLDKTYVQRGAEADLNRLLAGGSPGMILIGDTGMGKTTLLSQWGRRMLDQGHAVFMHQCDKFLSEAVEDAIASDLDIKNSADVISVLRQVADLPDAGQKRLILIFDTVNSFRREGGEPKDLLRRIDNLVGRLANTSVRVIVGCSMATWKRLDRLNVLDQLTWNSYLQSDGRAGPVALESFTPDEAQKAFSKYQEAFQLKTDWGSLSPEVRERLRRPFLLGLVAQTFTGQPLPHEAILLTIYGKYYGQRIKSYGDRAFVDLCAAEMLRQKRIVLRIDAGIDRGLRDGIENNNPDSPYHSLLESGVLTETQGVGFEPDTVQFCFIQIAAFAMARWLLLQPEQTPRDAVIGLVPQAHSFSFAWEVAKVLLRMQPNRYEMLRQLAGDLDPEVRELVAEMLVDFQYDEPSEVQEWIRATLNDAGPEACRTALKAAYYIGPAARAAFLWVATEGTPDLRELARDTLYAAWRKGTAVPRDRTLALAYLTWRVDPNFAYTLLDELLAHISVRQRDVFEFIVSLSVTIYINHCEREEVIHQTADLYERIAGKLHLRLLRTDLFGQKFERFLFGGIAEAFSKPILQAALLSDGVDAFFLLPPHERDCLRRIAGFVDPRSDITAAGSDLAQMLQAKVEAYNVAAALVVGIHALARFGDCEHFFRELFDTCDGHGRLWLLMSFTVLVPGTPREWIPLLEIFTTKFMQEHRDLVLGDDPLLHRLDVLLTPLGLAYAKAEMPMTAITKLMDDAGERGDQPLLTSCLNAMGTLAIYYPQPVLAVFGQLLKKNPEIQPRLEKPLTVARALHIDEVDQFLSQAGIDDEFRRRIAAQSSMELVAQYIHTLGFYNNAVHFSVNYPRMRETFSKGALISLASSQSSREFLGDYTSAAFRMFRQSGFRLLEWTRRD